MIGEDPTAADVPQEGPPEGLNGELLLAATGLRGFLEREHDRVTLLVHAKARRIPKQITDDLRAFVVGETPSRPPGRPEKARKFPFLETTKQLAQPIQLSDVQGLVGAHQEGSDAADVMVPLTRAIAYLNGIAPRRFKQNLVTSDPVLPSDQEAGRFGRIFGVVDDPTALLEHLRAQRLLGDEVQAVAAVYPVIYGLMEQAAGRAIADVLAKNDKFRLPGPRERMLRTFLQAGPQDPTLVSAMQASFAQDQAAGQDSGGSSLGGGRLRLKTDTYRTSGQGSEAGGR